MRYASARDGAFTDTPIYDHVAWLLEQKYLWESASSDLRTKQAEDDWFSSSDSYESSYPSAESYYPSYDTYDSGRHMYTGGGRHRAYAA